MKGDGVGFTLAGAGGGNTGVCVGVRGDESCAEAGDEPVSRKGGSGPSRLGATEVTFESPDPMPESRTRSSVDAPTLCLNVGDLIAVLAFDEFFDLVDSLERSSLSFFGDLTPDVREFGRGVSSSAVSSCTLLIRFGVAFLCDTSVSGGLGGLPSLGTVTCGLKVGNASVDLVFALSSPTSVDSGV